MYRYMIFLVVVAMMIGVVFSRDTYVCDNDVLIV
jgi:hypothetical protein